VGFLLVTWALPGAAPGATPERGLGSEGSESPASVESIESCRQDDYGATLSTQVAVIRACVERLPGGVRAHFFFRVAGGGTANFKGTLHTCTTEFGCSKSRDFWIQGVDSDYVAVATAWDTACHPTRTATYGYIRLLDIRFMPSGELHQGTGPYLSYYFYLGPCYEV
jgi:hypothetical protein